MRGLGLQLAILGALFALGPLVLRVLADPRGRTMPLRLTGTRRAVRLHWLQARAWELVTAAALAWLVVYLLEPRAAQVWLNGMGPPPRGWREYVASRVTFGCGLLVILAYGIEQWAALLHLDGAHERRRLP